MGNFTFAEFKAHLKFLLGEREDLPVHSVLGDLYGEWINQAYMTLTTKNSFFGKRIRLKFPELMTSDGTQVTVDGTAYISTPTDALYVEGIWDDENDVDLQGISWDKYKSYTGRADTTAEGKPTEWVRRGALIYLYKTPDDAYDMTIYYQKRVDRLDGSTYNTTELGEEWDEPILQLAVIQSFQRLRMFDEASKLKPEWLETVVDLAKIYDREEFDREMQITPHAGWMGDSKFYGR